jgi:2-oxoglutarate-Fe(II)-dependent oxygenase superfamily protein
VDLARWIRESGAAAAKAAAVNVPLSDALSENAWLRCSWPFPHIVARNVFKPDYYKALERQICEILTTRSEEPDQGRLGRNLPGYDTHAVGLAPMTGQPTDLFFSRDWRDVLARVWGVSPTPYMVVWVHHHTPGSASGWVHNDFNPTWFPRTQDDRIRTLDSQLCAFQTGAGPLPPEQKIELVRGAALILFVANDEWWPGDGGETGLYESVHSSVADPAVAWPPENNSLVSFECTPQSFHAFLTNTRIARTSIIMWIHRPLEEAVSMYGADNLEPWPK